MMDKTFEGKVVLVTGGTRGLGVELTRAFADRGATVAISYVASKARAEAMVAELEGRGVKAAAFQADQADRAQAAGLIDAVVARFGKLDILINNAAVSAYGLIDSPDTDFDALDHAWAVNVMGLVATTRAAAKVMSDNGRIIFLGSSMGKVTGMPAAADNSGMKSMMDGYARGVARDLAPRGITVNVVHAGLMKTDMTITYAKDLEAAVKAFAFPRFAELEEMVRPVLFFADPATVMITGVSIDADGGRLA